MRKLILILPILVSLRIFASDLSLDGNRYTYSINDPDITTELFNESGYRLGVESCEKGHTLEKRILTNKNSFKMGACFKTCETGSIRCEFYIDQI